MTKKAKKIILPRFVVTETAQVSDPDSVCIELPAGSPIDAYYVRPRRSTVGERPDSKLGYSGARFNLFPVVVDSSGEPWPEANVYLLSRIEEAINPAMATYAAIADDLAAFRSFLFEDGIDWTNFPTHKLGRPTYRYNGYLRLAVAAGEVRHTTARRRMSSIIGFYNWLQAGEVVQLANPPWKAQDRFIRLADAKGIGYSRHVTTTDVSIRLPTQVDPYAGTVDDGGKLRPLTLEEQGWVVTALLAQENTEMTLIHLLGLLTGARIQTILTFRVRHMHIKIDDRHLEEIRLPVGAGTEIDTKNNKRMVLHLPRWFFEMLRVYAFSERARRRRERAHGGDTENQYLFLSARGVPFYQSKSESVQFNETNELRHPKVGQAVRQFIVEKIIPYIRKHHSSTFKYKFHDTRASFGMNLTDHQLALVATGAVTLHQAREFVKTRMGHQSAATTDLYLQYRSNLKLVRQVAQDYSAHLRELTAAIMKEAM